MADGPVRTAHVSLAQALSQAPPPTGNLAVPVFAHWRDYYGLDGGEAP